MARKIACAALAAIVFAGLRLAAPARAEDEPAPAPGVAVNMMALGTYLQYTGPLFVKNVMGAIASGDALWPVGVGIRVGAEYYYSELSKGAGDNYWQAAPLAGVEFGGGGWSGEVAGSWLFSNYASVNTAKIALARVGYESKVGGLSISAAGSFYPGLTVVQIDPRGVWHVNEKLSIGVGPELQEIGAHRDGDPPQQILPQAYGSFWAFVNWRVVEPLTLYVAGFAGERQYSVDLDGLTVWANNDLFVGGYEVNLSVAVGRGVGLFIDFQHEFGSHQEYLLHHFALLGGSLGLTASF